MMLGPTELLVIFGLIAVVGLGAFVIFSRGRTESEVDVWARRHGLVLTAASRPWVEQYLRVGRNLRQVGGIGGLVVAASVTAATGLDLRVSGMVWLLLGYLAGALWAELALTRLPAGTRRAASLVTRRLSDYLPRRMLTAQVVGPAIAVGLGVLSMLAYQWNRDWRISRGIPDGAGLVVTSAHPTDEVLHSGALVAAAMAPAIMFVVWLAQRYLIGRPQPMVEPSLVDTDDALRSSSTQMLGASALAAVCLLVGGQFGYLLSTSFERSGVVSAVLAIGLVASFLAAYVSFLWRNTPRPVHHAPVGPHGTPPPEASGPPGSTVADPAVPSGPAPPAPDDGWGAQGASAGSPATDLRSRLAPSDIASVDGAVWSMRRSPVPIAVAVVVVLGLAGWYLRSWGPINPAVSVYNHGLVTDASGEAIATLQVHNDAKAPIAIVSARAVPRSDTWGGVGPQDTPPEVESVTVSSPGGGDRRPTNLPIEMAGQSWLQLDLEMTPAAFSCLSGPIERVPFDVEIAIRTQSGRTMTERVPVEPIGLVDCIPPLPTGPQPADPVAAEAAVRSAANTVYNPTSGDERLQLIDDPRGVAETGAAAAAGPFSNQMASTYATIGEISFDRPDRAWFHYVLSVGFGTRTGEAVLVDGQWKVTRGTVCADLALANETCPPLPG